MSSCSGSSDTRCIHPSRPISIVILIHILIHILILITSLLSFQQRTDSIHFAMTFTYQRGWVVFEEGAGANPCECAVAREFGEAECDCFETRV